MSKNVVDGCIKFSKDHNQKIGLIPSRRQVDKFGGYSNDWTTKSFFEYSKSDTITLVRDHAGPLQGEKEDDGQESLIEDCQYFDYIHIDPWKNAKNLDDGIAQTIDLISLCEKQDCKPKGYEIGTEEAIFQYSPNDLYRIIKEVSFKVPNVKYAVIQSGTALSENSNTGIYDKARLSEMVDVCDSFGLISKEHNGDFLPPGLVQEKFSLGLDSINIAPEFAQIETKVYMDLMSKENRVDLLEFFYALCKGSNKWVKWFPKGFDPDTNKNAVILASGHYTFSYAKFGMISRHFPQAQDMVISNVSNRLRELHGI